MERKPGLLKRIRPVTQINFWGVAELREVATMKLLEIQGGGILERELRYRQNGLGPNWRWYDISALSAIDNAPAIVHTPDHNYPTLGQSVIIPGKTLRELLEYQKTLNNIGDFLILGTPYKDLDYSKLKGEFRSIFIKKPKSLLSRRS